MAAVSSAKVGSLSGRTKAIGLNGRLVGGMRDRTVKLAKMSNANIRKAQERIAQPKPTSGINLMTMTGRITPPRDDPAATRPSAAPRFAKNHVDAYNTNEHHTNRMLINTHTCKRRVENHRRSNGRADGLGQKDLVIFFGNARHH